MSPSTQTLKRGEVSSPRFVGSTAGKMYKFLPVLFLQKGFSRLTHPEVVHGGYCLLKFLGNLHGDILEKAGLNWAKGRQRGPIVLSSCKAKSQGDLRNEQRPKKMSPPSFHPQVLSSISSSGSRKIRRGAVLTLSVIFTPCKHWDKHSLQRTLPNPHNSPVK